MFLGIDQSYTSTGIIVLDEKGEIYLHRIISSDKETCIFKRAWDISETISDIIEKNHITSVAIEGLAFSMRGDATRDLAGLQFLIVSKIKYVTNTPIDIVSPPALKKFGSGNGKASKDEMIAALPENILTLFKDFGYKKSKGLTDITDAYFLAKYAFEKCNK